MADRLYGELEKTCDAHIGTLVQGLTGCSTDPDPDRDPDPFISTLTLMPNELAGTEIAAVAAAKRP